MLQNPSSCLPTPLFGTGPISPSSASENKVIIRRPACEPMSFDWSDFPIIIQHNYVPDDTPTQTLSFSHSIADAISTSSSKGELSISSTKSSRFNKRVTFSTTLEVRTHSIVLGDHPCCESFPVELGWDYDATQCVELETHERNKAYCAGVKRRSYFERKHLLQDYVADLEVQCKAQSNLHKTAPSSRQLADLDPDNECEGSDCC